MNLLALATLVFTATPAAPAQEQPWSLDLTVHDVGVGIGGSQHIDGLRLNARDTAPFVVHGVNLTLWTPRNTGDGTVDGLALGLPLTGAGDIRGLGIGFGIEAIRNFDGIGIAPIGLGAGGNLRGIFVSGIGAGAGGDVDGFAFGGVGIGAGGNMRGIVLGGLGAGCGGSLTGIGVGGLGIGVGGDIRGIVLGGLGAGAGGNIDGIVAGLVGVGAGGRIRGLAIGGVGVGAGGTIEGLAIGGIGVGAPAVRGGVVALASRSKDFVGVAVSPAYFEIVPDGRMAGLSVSAFNQIRGEQDGVAIGIVNYTPELHGVQLGLLNWAGNNRSGLKLLPLANAHFD